MLTQARLKELLHYNPETGLFTRVKALQKGKIGSIAGYDRLNSYVKIGLDRKYYMAHRLAWFYMTGKWPNSLIDHINGIKNDNRWANLREATSQQNNWNKKVSRLNRTGLKGVYLIRNKYRVYICLGSFSNKEEAKAAYNKAAEKLHGEFFRE